MAGSRQPGQQEKNQQLEAWLIAEDAHLADTLDISLERCPGLASYVDNAVQSVRGDVVSILIFRFLIYVLL